MSFASFLEVARVLSSYAWLGMWIAFLVFARRTTPPLLAGINGLASAIRGNTASHDTVSDIKRQVNEIHSVIVKGAS